MSKTVKVEEAELIKLILNYMKKRNMFRSYFALELESQVQVEQFSKEMKFFRMLILEGNFDEAESFLTQFQGKLGDAYFRAVFEMKKQRYFELIEAKPDIEMLVRILKDIERLVSAEVYKNLCFFLTLKSINDHPEYIDWSVQKGRMTCFEAIRPLLKALGKSFHNTGNTYAVDLSQLVQRLLAYESDDFKHNSSVQLQNVLLNHDDHRLRVEYVLSDKKQAMMPSSQLFSVAPKTTQDPLSQSVQVPMIDESNTEVVPKSKLAFHNRIKSNEAGDQQLMQSQHNAELQASFASQRRGPSNLYSFRNDQPGHVRTKSKNSSEDPDKVVIIEKLYISDSHNEGSEGEVADKRMVQSQQSSLFNYNFEEMVQAGHLSDTHPIRAAIFSADGEYFAIGTNSKSLRIYSMKSLLVQDPSKTVPTSHEIPILYERRNHHLGSIYCIDWSRSGKLIATGSNDKMVKVMSVPDLSEASESCDELRLLGHKGIVRSVSFTHDETKLLSAGQVDTCIRVWDVGTGQQIRTLEGHTQAIYCLQVGGDGSYQVSAGLDKTLRLWDLRQSKPIATILMSAYAEINYVSLSESANNYNLQTIIKGSKKANNMQAFHGQQSLAALAHADGTVTVWDLPSQRCIKQIAHHSMDCRCVEFDPTSRYLATASFDSTITIYDYEQQRLVTTIDNHEDRVHSLLKHEKVVLCRWHPFYPFILSTSADSTGRIFAPHSFLQQLIKSFHN